MESWKIQAIASAFFAGITAVVAKFGLENISADLGLAIRTAFVFGFVLVNVFVWRDHAGLGQLTARQIGFLAASAGTTAASWIYYYRAMKDGPLSMVALIDKGSVVVTLLLSFLLLREPLTPRLVSGATLILAGILVLTVKR